MRGIAHNADIQRVWNNQTQLARILQEVRNGNYRPRSPSPVPPLPPFPTLGNRVNDRVVSPAPPVQRPPPVPHQEQCWQENDDYKVLQRGPSVFARYLNALLFPGLPQVLMQPFSFQDALIGAVLMLVAAYGWITFAQAHLNASTGVVSAESPLQHNYLQYWPALLHLLSLLHVCSMS